MRLRSETSSAYGRSSRNQIGPPYTSMSGIVGTNPRVSMLTEREFRGRRLGKKSVGQVTGPPVVVCGHSILASHWELPLLTVRPGQLSQLPAGVVVRTPSPEADAAPFLSPTVSPSRSSPASDPTERQLEHRNMGLQEPLPDTVVPGP